MLGIIICIVLIFLLLIAAFICLLKDEPIAALSAFIVAIICVVILCYDVNTYENEQYIDEDTVPEIVYDVSEPQVDTNIVITDTDTIEVYTIKYCD